MTGETTGPRGRGRPRKVVPEAAAPGMVRTIRRAIGYVRVSTGDQANGYGLDAQRAAIETYADTQGWVVVGLVEDAGISGTYGLDDRAPDGALRRAGLHAAIEAVEAGEADTLVVYNAARLARGGLTDFGAVWDRLDRIGDDTFHSVTEPHLNIPAIRHLMRGLMAGMAIQERIRILDGMRGGRQAKLAAGGIVGRLPFGYRLTGDRRAGRVEIVEDQAHVVRAIHAARAEGRTLAAIAADLNDASTPGPTGGKWHPTAVLRILDNDAYRGTLVWGRRHRQQGKFSRPEGVTVREGVLPAIVPGATFRTGARDGAGATAAA